MNARARAHTNGRSHPNGEPPKQLKPFSDYYLTSKGYRLTNEYTYTEEDGELLYQVLRYEHPPEGFVLDGGAPAPAPAPAKGVLGYADDVVRALAQGATFGFADELAAKADELIGRGGTYEQNLAAEKKRNEEIPAALRVPGEIAGAVAGTLAAAPIAAPLAAATGVAESGQRSG